MENYFSLGPLHFSLEKFLSISQCRMGGARLEGVERVNWSAYVTVPGQGKVLRFPKIQYAKFTETLF